MKNIPSIDFTFHCNEHDGLKYDIKADSGRDAVKGLAVFILVLAKHWNLNAEEIAESVNKYVRAVNETGLMNDLKINKK